MEEKFISAEDFMNVLELRSDLIYCTTEDLIDAFSEDNDYIEMIKALYLLVDIDNGGFAILDEDITNRIYTLLNLKRYEMKNVSNETFQLINEIIIKLNEVNALPEDAKIEFIDNYAVNQEQNRNLEFKYTYELLDSMGTDSFIIDYLAGEEIPDDLEEYNIIGSLVYLNNTMPELFDIKEVQDKIDDLLSELSIFKKEKKTTLFEKIKRKVLSR